MFQFMREGGFGMWLMLAVALGAAAATVARRRGDGARYALAGVVAIAVLGPLGFSTGMYNVVAAVGRAPAGEQMEWLTVGLREAVHNFTLAAILGTGLGALGIGVALTGRAPSAR